MRRSFRGQNLSGADFSRTDLSGVDFTDAILDRANFSHADLRGAIFRRSSLIGANLQFTRSGIANDRNLIFRSALLILAVSLGLLARFTGSLIVELLINESRVLDIYHNVKFVIPWQTVFGLLSICLGSIYLVTIYIATYYGTCFDQANLTDANLEYALLANTNLTAANLTRTNLHGVMQLNSAKLDRTILTNSLVRNLLVTHQPHNRSYLDCNLQGAYLAGADLTNTDFTGANLSNANLSNSRLFGANLMRTFAINTDFQFANLTGACIADWSIDQTTNLANIDCDYVYLKSPTLDRCPASGSFKHGDFAQLFQEIRNTVDLIFHHGIDWTSFNNAWQQIQIENDGTPLSICSIEHKGAGKIVVKVEVPLNSDKDQLHQDFDRSYQLLLQTVEDRYQAEISGRDAQIERLRQRELAIYHEQQNNLQNILQSLVNLSTIISKAEQLVTIKLGTRDADHNLAVTVEISDRGLPARAAAVGKLDDESNVMAAYQDWKNAYRKYIGNIRLDIPAIQMTSLKEPIFTKIQHKDYLNECQKAAQNLRRKLNQWLDGEDFKSIRELIFQELQPSQLIQISIQTDELEIRRLPFQLWDIFDRFTQAEITVASSTYRSVPKKSTTQEQLKILAIFGDSQGVDIDVDRELLFQLPNTQVEFLTEPTRQILNDKLWSQAWDIIFFAGHSASDPNLTTGYLKINATDRLTITELKYALKQSITNGLKLVIINSCDGLGLATELISIQLPQAIVMREPVPDFVAQQFLKYFLIAFASGLPLDRSVRQAREQLQGLEDRYPCASWLPIICQNPAENI